VQQLGPLPFQRSGKGVDTGSIAAGAIEAGDNT
jgi:hypothetical protein